MANDPITDSLDVAALARRLVIWRRRFHARPEPGWCEFWTCAELARELTALGWTVRVGEELGDGSGRMGLPSREALRDARRRAGERLGDLPGADSAILRRMGACTGLVADIAPVGAPSGAPPAVALRCDMDALPVPESADAGHRPAREGFASRTPGVSHACGHDGHMAILLGAAALVAADARAGRLRAPARLLCQPAEEGVRGAAYLIPHVAGVPVLLCGHIGLGAPADTLICGVSGGLATTKFDVEFVGREAHAAHPEAGRDALLGAARAVLGLHALTAGAPASARVSVGTCRAGVTRNVIAGRALLECETRGCPDEVDAALMAGARAVVARAAAEYGLETRLTVRGHTGCLDSDASLAREVAALAAGMEADLPRFATIVPEGAMPASEDAAALMREVRAHGGRAVYMLFGSRLAGGHHTATFDFEEDLLVEAALVLARAVRVLGAR